jgi:hypothetical protein
MRLSRLLLLTFPLGACASLSAHSADPGAPPSSFVRTTAELRASRMIEVREGVPKTQALRMVIEGLEPRYTIEVTDPRAGFVMTAWQSSVIRDGAPDLRYRTRLTARFMGDDWRTLQLRGEANWARGDEWDIGYDVAQLDSVATDLRARLSRKP